MITLTRIRDLLLPKPITAGRPAHLSAASGLVRQGDLIYVVADDEHHLGVFPVAGEAPGRLVRLFDDDLPPEARDRKRRKPDFEALILLPPASFPPDGALLAIGSGSKPNRRLGALLRLTSDSEILGAAETVDLSSVLVPLEDRFPDVNIEGAVVVGDQIRFFQRGNNRSPASAVVSFDLALVVGAITSRSTTALAPSTIVTFDLGCVDGIPFGVTDASTLPDGTVVFTAVAEDTADSYADGRCAGAVIGMIGPDGALGQVQSLDRPYKVEGVDARIDGPAIDLLLVTDADDPAIPSGLFSARFER